MRPKYLFFVGLIIILMLILLFFRQQKQSNTLLKPIAQNSQAASPISDASAESKKTNSLPHANGSSSTNQAPTVNDREKTNEIRQYMESQNKPIEFYGQVVDQDQNPLAGVSVKGEALHVKVIIPTAWGDEDEIIPISKETDSAGRFEIEGISGRAVELESIQKSGYEAEPIKRAWKTSEGFFENPVIFKMWSTNIHEHLITGEKKFQITPDGRPYFIDLTKGTIAESGIGDLKVWIQYTNQSVHGEYSDWSSEIDVINGGLQKSDSYSMFSAPSEGYVPSFVWKNQIKGGQYGSSGERRFYVMLKNGREYGRISIELFAPYTDEIPGLIRLSYVINPSGSRILR
jgi:hypothetical protein